MERRKPGWRSWGWLPNHLGGVGVGNAERKGRNGSSVAVGVISSNERSPPINHTAGGKSRNCLWI